MNLLDGLVIAYHLDGDLEPAHGYRALQGSVQFSQGKFGQAAVFDGTRNIKVPWNLIGQGSSRTISLWIYVTDIQNSVYIFAGNDNIGQFSTWGILSLGVDLILLHGGITDIFAPLTARGWSHAVYTFDAATSMTALYLNGILLGDGPIPDDPTFSDNNYIFMGGAQSLFFSGMIDEVVIWDRALSASEVLEVGLAPYPFGESSCQVSWDDDLLVYSSGFQAALAVKTASSGVGSWD